MLTARQIACLEGVAQHKTAKQIALNLGISYHAVESHLKAARRKLGASSTSEALEVLHGTARPYYGARPTYHELTLEQYHGLVGLSADRPSTHPKQAARLDEAAYARFARRPKRIWEYDYELTPQRTVMLIAVATIGFIAAIALLLVIGMGVNLLVWAHT